MSVTCGRRVAFIGTYDTLWQGHAALLIKRLPGGIGIGGYLATTALLAWRHDRCGDRDPIWP